MKFSWRFILTFIIAIAVVILGIVSILLIDKPKVSHSRLASVPKSIFFEAGYLGQSFSSKENGILVWHSENYTNPLIYDDIYIFDLQNPKEAVKIPLKSFFDDLNSVEEIEIDVCSTSPSGRYFAMIAKNEKRSFLVVASYDKKSRTVSLVSKFEINNSYTNICWTDDEKKFVLYNSYPSSAAQDRRIVLYNCEKKTFEAATNLDQFQNRKAMMADIAVQNNAESILIAFDSGQIISWRPATDEIEEIHSFKIDGKIQCAKFNSDGTLLAACIMNGYLDEGFPNLHFQILDVQNNAVLYEKRAPHYIMFITWSPDSATLAFTDELGVTILNCKPILFYSSSRVIFDENKEDNIADISYKREIFPIPKEYAKKFPGEHVYRTLNRFTDNCVINLYDNKSGYIAYYAQNSPVARPGSRAFVRPCSIEDINDKDNFYGEFVLLKVDIR
ncbi:MAG: hypothetical protein IJG38_10390 [Thermoguttaceae bacterium]|nr:hypothetical protein [Thermoguttaceae bacterium]